MAKSDTTMGGVRATLGVGMATLVTVLVAVLLTTFSVLSLVSARADINLSTKAAEAMSAYYMADGEAEAWLASIGEQLIDANGDTDVLTNSRDYTMGATSDGNLILSRSFTIDSARNLNVEVAILDNGVIEVRKWQVTAVN